MKTIILAIPLLLLALAAPTKATMVLFNGGEWIGTFDPAVPFDFHAFIGNCAKPIDCFYNDPVEGNGALTAKTTVGFEIIGTQGELHGIADGVRFWQTDNGFDTVYLPSTFWYWWWTNSWATRPSDCFSRTP